MQNDFHYKPIKILGTNQVLEIIPLSKSSLVSLVKQGNFPKPFVIAPGGRALGWLEADIINWIEQQSKGATCK
jgi:prophage regulatory protein